MFCLCRALSAIGCAFRHRQFYTCGANGRRSDSKLAATARPYRSYLYAADLAIWLWTILFRGASDRPYNVGEEAAVTIMELANEIAAFFGTDVVVAQQPAPHVQPDRYVPSTRRAREGLRRVPVFPSRAPARTAETGIVPRAKPVSRRPQGSANDRVFSLEVVSIDGSRK